ncbi:MAG: sulfite exporter TauE/SafE family protein [Evtepia sp.]
MALNLQHKQLRIGGMTCINCQNKIEQTLRRADGVQAASVRYDTGTAEVTYDTDLLSLEDLTAMIQALDYQVLAEGAGRTPDASRRVSLAVIILCLFFLLEKFGILNLLAPSQLADSAMSYGMLFVIGLVTSVHCVAMCGGINLSQCLPQADAGQQSMRASLLPAFLYNLGRVLSYTAIGFLLGLVVLLLGGGGAGPSPLLQGILKLIAGVLMVIMGLAMLDLFPGLRRLTLRPPRFLAAKVGAQKARHSRPLVVGLLNGLMPCGPLQSMQLVALAAGDPFSGALAMFLFSLGTVPLMLGLGSAVAALGRRFSQTVRTWGRCWWWFWALPCSPRAGASPASPAAGVWAPPSQSLLGTAPARLSWRTASRWSPAPCPPAGIRILRSRPGCRSGGSSTPPPAASTAATTKCSSRPTASPTPSRRGKTSWNLPPQSPAPFRTAAGWG